MKSTGEVFRKGQIANLGLDNSCIYQDMLPIQDLGPNPYIYLLSTGHLEAGAVFTRHVQLSLVCTTLSHRINRIQDGTRSHTELVETFYRYRGIIISALNEYISIEHKRISDITLAGIVTLLLIDVSSTCLPLGRTTV